MALQRRHGVVRSSALWLIALVATMAAASNDLVAHKQLVYAAGAPVVKVSGSHLVDGSNNTIRLLGINYDGAEDACWQNGGTGFFYGPSDATSVQAMVAWHVNAVRLPVNEDCWLGINNTGNSQYFGAAYQKGIGDYVALLHSYGIYAVIDLQENAPGAIPADDFQVLPDADHAPAFWKSVAAYFLAKGDQGVLFDLINEPHLGSSAPSNSDWDCWQNGCTLNTVSSGGGTVSYTWQTASMQSLVDAVRSTGSTQPVLIDGLAWASEFGQFLARMPNDSAHQLIPTLHVYDWYGASTGSTSGWAAQVQPLLNAGLPVVTGELGENDCAHGIIDAYMNWADSLGVSYLGWAWNPNSCSAFPALISDWSGTPTNFGVGLRNHLAALATSSPLVVAAAASPVAGTAPLAVSFTGSVSGGTPPYSFSWNFGDGSAASTAQSPSHTYSSPGNYTATLTVTDGAANSQSASAPAVVVAAAALTASASASVSAGDAPLTVGFLGSAAGGTPPYSYSWAFGDGGTSTQQNPSHQYLSGGTYQAVLMVSDSSASSAAAAAITVVVQAATRVAATAVPQAGDAPLTVAFTGTAAAGTAPYSYAWTFGDGTSGTGSTPSHRYSAAGTYTATLTVTDAAAQAQTAQVTVVVSPPLSVTVAATPLIVDVAESVNFSSTPVGGLGPYHYGWDFGDGSAASTSQNPSHAYAASGMYTATLTLSDANAAKATATVLVNVHALPTVTATATPATGDAPVTVNLSSTSSGGLTPYAYSWDFGDGSAAVTTQNATHLYTSAGTYTATVTLTDAAGQSVKATASVSVSSPLGASAGASPTSGPAPMTVNFTVTPAGGRSPFTYSWTFGDGSPASNTKDPTHVYANAGTFAPQVTVTDANGATTTATAPTITVTPTILTVVSSGTPVKGDAPLPVTFTATATGGTAPVTYAWDFGDSISGSGAGPSHTYVASGTYVATVTASDAGGQKATAQATIVVSPALTLNASSSPQNADRGDTINFTSTPGGGSAPYAYSWNFGDGSALATTQNPAHVYSTAGSYSATVTITDANGSTKVANVQVVVNSLPAVTATATPTAGDAPLSVTLGANGAGGSQPLTYTWNFGDGTPGSTVQNPSHTYSSAGTYTAQVTLTDAAGHSATASATVTVSAALTVTAAATPSSGQAPLTVNLSAAPTGGRTPYTYSWNFGDGTATSTSQNPAHVYASAGTYTATVAVSDANGVSVTASAPAVTVTVAPLVVSASRNPTAGDAPLAVTFSGSATGGTAPLSYAWAFGDGSNGTGTAPSHTYVAAGTYTAVLTVTDAKSLTSTAQVTVVVAPALSVTATVSPVAVDQGDTVSFTSSPTGGLAPYLYSWNFGDGSALSSIQNPSHAYSSPAMYSATVTVTDANGVKMTASALVNVHAQPTVSATATPAAGDAPLTVNFGATPGAGTAPYTSSWDFGDGSVPSATLTASHLYGAPGNYTARLTLTDSVGHSVASSIGVTVSPALSATAGATPTSGQAPLTVDLSATPTGGHGPYTYAWAFGDGSASSPSQNPIHSYGGPGTFVAQVTVTDGYGATTTVSAPAVAVSPAPLTASATMSKTVGDLPFSTTLSGLATGGTPPFTYAWDLGDGSTSTQQTFSHVYAAGSYTVNLIITDGAGKSAQATALHVSVYPALAVSTTVTPTSGQAPLAVNFSVAATGGLAPYTYSWAFGDGTSAAGVAGTHSYGSGNFAPTLTVNDSAGGTWSGVVAGITSTAPASSTGGGGSGAGGGGAPAASGGASTPTPSSSPAASPSATATAQPSATAAAAAPSGSNSGGGSPMLPTLIGSVMATGVAGLLFVAWRRRRLG